ncbi:MAG: hypothetical protein ACYSUF_05085 [Planctomycetota bacterium]
MERELSLQEIADGYGCTRVMILYLMKRHGIPRRSLSEARRNAVRDGKIRYTFSGSDGGLRSVKHQRTSLNERFFRGWSPEMAYVLGVFYTDGCLSVSKTGYLSATIRQKEPELLEKCLAKAYATISLHSVSTRARASPCAFLMLPVVFFAISSADAGMVTDRFTGPATDHRPGTRSSPQHHQRS